MSKTYKILIVEDSPVAQRCCSMALKKVADFNICLADTGEEAIGLFENGDFDFIFMDIGLPGISGIETTTKIRKMGLIGKNVPIVALTANESSDIKLQCNQSGMNDYIQKPLTYDKAANVFKKYLQII